LDSLQDFGNIQGGLRQAGEIALQTAASVSKVKEVLSTRRIILNRLGVGGMGKSIVRTTPKLSRDVAT
jgi:hypothetical protein